MPSKSVRKFGTKTNLPAFTLSNLHTRPLFTKGGCERIAPITLYKRVTVSELLSISFKKSDVSDSSKSLSKNEPFARKKRIFVRI